MFDKIMTTGKELLQKAGECAAVVLGKAKKNKKAVAAGAAGLILIAAASVIISLAVNVWSWTDVTVNLPYELYVSCTDAISDSDVGQEYITEVVLPGIAVSGSDTASATDAVSETDVVSDSDAVLVKMHIKKEQTVEQILDLAGIVLDEAYSIDRSLDEVISEPAVITIYKLKLITVQADGMTVSTYTGLKTVAELLAEQMIVVDENDRVSFALTDELVSGMNIVINRVDLVEEVRAEPVPYQTETRENKSMYVGESKTAVKGVDGSKDVTYRLTYVDGILESTEVIGEVITVQPINEIIENGTKKRPTTTTKKTNAGRYVVSREKVYDCDGSGHGYYIIIYSDGTVEYKDF